MHHRVRASADLHAVPCSRGSGPVPALLPLGARANPHTMPCSRGARASATRMPCRATRMPSQAMFAVGCQGPPAPTPSGPVPCARGSVAAAPPADLGQLCAMGPGSEPARPPQAPCSCGGWKATVRSPPAVPPAPRRRRCAIRSELPGQPFARVQARPGAPRARGELGAGPAGRGEGRGSGGSAKPPSQTGAAGPLPEGPAPAASHPSSS